VQLFGITYVHRELYMLKVLALTSSPWIPERKNSLSVIERGGRVSFFLSHKTRKISPLRSATPRAGIPALLLPAGLESDKGKK